MVFKVSSETVQLSSSRCSSLRQTPWSRRWVIASSVIWEQLDKQRRVKLAWWSASALTVMPVICWRSSRSRWTSVRRRGARYENPWSVNNTQPASSRWVSCVQCWAICRSEESESRAQLVRLRCERGAQEVWRNANRAVSFRLVQKAKHKWVRCDKCWPSAAMVGSSSIGHPFSLRCRSFGHPCPTAWRPCPVMLRHHAKLSFSSWLSWLMVNSVEFFTLSTPDRSRTRNWVAVWRKHPILAVERDRQSFRLNTSTLGQWSDNVRNPWPVSWIHPLKEETKNDIVGCLGSYSHKSDRPW